MIIRPRFSIDHNLDAQVSEFLDIHNGQIRVTVTLSGPNKSLEKLFPGKFCSRTYFADQYIIDHAEAARPIKVYDDLDPIHIDDDERLKLEVSAYLENVDGAYGYPQVIMKLLQDDVLFEAKMEWRSGFYEDLD